MPTTTSLAPKAAAHKPWLLAISLTRWNYVLSILADAAMALAMLSWSAATLDRPTALLPVGIAALLGYTLTEYSWHRFLFHSRHPSLRSLREGHARHHGTPRAPLALPFFTAIPHGLVVWGLGAAVVGTSLGAFFSGIWMLGYVAYSGLHHLVHAEAGEGLPGVRWLRDVHETHHSRPGRNFGVTSPLWDVVFGTWSSPRRG